MVTAIQHQVKMKEWLVVLQLLMMKVKIVFFWQFFALSQISLCVSSEGIAGLLLLPRINGNLFHKHGGVSFDIWLKWCFALIILFIVPNFLLK